MLAAVADRLWRKILVFAFCLIGGLTPARSRKRDDVFVFDFQRVSGELPHPRAARAGQESKEPNADKTARQGMQQKASQKLIAGNGHLAFLIAGARTLSEGNRPRKRGYYRRLSTCSVRALIRACERSRFGCLRVYEAMLRRIPSICSFRVLI